jgi:hypothetical protein
MLNPYGGDDSDFKVFTLPSAGSVLPGAPGHPPQARSAEGPGRGGRQNTSRKKLAAAIVLSAPEDAEKLARLLRRYRRSTAGDAHVGPIAAGNVI